MRPDEDIRGARVREEVLNYLLEHPDASDSLEGIRLWWLPNEERVSPSELMVVLEKLSHESLLIARGESPDTRIYALNKDSQDRHHG